MIRNVGRGPAFHVHIQPIREGEVCIDFADAQWVEASGDVSVPLKAYATGRSERKGEHTMSDIFTLVRQGGLTRPIQLKVMYEDLFATSYTTLITLDFTDGGACGFHFVSTEKNPSTQGSVDRLYFGG
jgi:hypothetical protein